MNLLSTLDHLFYPLLCPGCGSDSIDRKELICIECYSELPFTHFNTQRENRTEKTFYGRIKIESAMSLLYFSKSMIVQNLIHELKYKGQQELGVFLGKIMGKSIQEASCFEDIDYVIPLPLSDRKKKLRGYNQSESLCNGISETTGKPVLSDNVIRFVDTSTQTQKHRRERWMNVDGIFKVRSPSLIEGKHILLVDDVITTGATLEACARSLLEIPNVRISIATLAIATK